MKQSEFKRRYDVKMGRYVKKHIYGEGISDVFKNDWQKGVWKDGKRSAKTATKKALKTAATKTGEYAGERAGDKIVQLLSKKNKNTLTPSTASSPIENPQTRELSNYEINERVNQLLSGGRMRKFINLLIYEIFQGSKLCRRI